MISNAPENKAARAEARDEKPAEPGPDGVVHIMQEEMEAERDAAENVPAYGIEEKPAVPVVIHAEELRMKGEAVADAIAAYEGPKIDAGLPAPEEERPDGPTFGGDGDEKPDARKSGKRR